MNALLAAFGIDWRLLLINLLNFGLLFWLLSHYLYGPLTRMLESRREKIAEGVRNAAEAEAKLGEINDLHAAMLAETGKAADQILADSRALAAEKQHKLIAEGEATAAVIISDAKRQADELQAQALVESKKEAAKLIVLGMEKLALGK